jgi:hypothetical protein
MKTPVVAVVVVLALASFVDAQTKPTQAERDQWTKESNNILESSSCKKITWLLEGERKVSAELPIHHALGWWGRGFIEGAVIIMGNAKVEKKANDFGLSVDVVAAHIATYCYGHQTETPFDAVQNLLLTVLN